MSEQSEARFDWEAEEDADERFREYVIRRLQKLERRVQSLEVQCRGDLQE